LICWSIGQHSRATLRASHGMVYGLLHVVCASVLCLVILVAHCPSGDGGGWMIDSKLSIGSMISEVWMDSEWVFSSSLLWLQLLMTVRKHYYSKEQMTLMYSFRGRFPSCRAAQAPRTCNANMLATLTPANQPLMRPGNQPSALAKCCWWNHVFHSVWGKCILLRGKLVEWNKQLYSGDKMSGDHFLHVAYLHWTGVASSHCMYKAVWMAVGMEVTVAPIFVKSLDLCMHNLWSWAVRIIVAALQTLWTPFPCSKLNWYILLIQLRHSGLCIWARCHLCHPWVLQVHYLIESHFVQNVVWDKSWCISAQGLKNCCLWTRYCLQLRRMLSWPSLNVLL